MKIALKDISGLLPKMLKTKNEVFAGWNGAISEMGERQLSVELCEACDKGRLKIWDAINTWFEDCQHCKGTGLIIRAVNHE